MDLKTVNLMLSFILLVINTGAVYYLLRSKAVGGAIFIKVFLLIITGSIELILGMLFLSPVLKQIGVDGEVVNWINSSSSFTVLVALIVGEIILYLMSRNRI